MKQSIFEVDVNGLRQLQEGKPKWVIVRELLQNAMDENITSCFIKMGYSYGKATITVSDDSPTGFRDLADAYTLFKDTYKRSDANKRGRFNFGEKQVICLCDYVSITTTTGGVEFDVKKGERKTLRTKTDVGSVILAAVKMSREEFDECNTYLDTIKPPKGIEVVVSTEAGERTLTVTTPHKTFFADLKTEIKKDDRMRLVTRSTPISLYKEETTYIYEMGIPICEIDCEYSIDVLQKVPLSNDRDKVDGKYLKDLFAVVLNNTVDEIDEEDISQTWIREAMDSDRVSAETVVEVKEKRFGEDAVIFNPNDPVANDEAIAQGFKLVHGSEMSSSEWSRMKTHAGLVSSSKMFGYGTATDAVEIKWEEKHNKISRLCTRMATTFLNLAVTVSFYKSKQASVLAQFGGSRISFNTSKIPSEWFDPNEDGYAGLEILNLIVHELAHSRGHHTEHSYHDCITRMAAKMTHKAIYDKNFFKLK